MIGHPKDLRYTQYHTWGKVDEKKHTARVGITEEMAERLQDVLSIDMPMVGDELEMDEPCVHIHKPNSIVEVSAPLTGRVLEINRDILDTPSLVCLAPYERWLFRMEYDEVEELDMLMNAAQYTAYLDTL